MQHLLLTLAALVVSLPLTVLASPCAAPLKNDGPPPARDLSAKVQASTACAGLPGITPKTLTSVWSSMLTNPRRGGKRFEAVPPEGLPTGKQWLADKGLEVDFSQVATEGLVRFELTSGGTVLFSAQNLPPGSAFIPRERLRLGAAHDWVLVTKRGTYRGTFDVPAAAELHAVNAQLASAAADPDPQVNLFLQAVILDNAEMYNARERVLGQLRQQLSIP